MYFREWVKIDEAVCVRLWMWYYFRKIIQLLSERIDLNKVYIVVFIFVCMQIYMYILGKLYIIYLIFQPLKG